MGEWEQLALLRKFPAFTGGLHELQVIQLKLWPFVYATHLKRHEFTWDVKTKVVEFKFTLTARKPPADLPERFEALDRSVKWMLGEDWSIKVLAKKKVLFESSGSSDLETRQKISEEVPQEPSFRFKTRMVQKSDGKLQKDE